LFSA
jgi:hypothetical protein